MQGGADAAGDADLRPAQRQRLRVPDQRRAGHRGGDQERRHRRLRGQQPAVQDPLRRRHQDQQDPLRQERAGLPVRLQARRPGPRPAARTGGPLHHPGVPVRARRDPDAQRGQGRAARHPRARRARARRPAPAASRPRSTPSASRQPRCPRSRSRSCAPRRRRTSTARRNSSSASAALSARRTLVINAADVTSTSQDAVTRVTDGFQDLISRTYTQLKLLGGVDLQRAAGRRCRQPRQRPVRRPALSKLARPGDEVLSFVLRKDRLGEQVTVKTIVDALPGQALRLGSRLDRGRRRLAGRHLEDHAHRRRQRPQAHRGRRRAAQHAEARARGGRPAEDLRRAQGRRVPQVLHRLLRRGATPRRTRWSWPGTAATSSAAKLDELKATRQPARSTRSSSSSPRRSRCSTRSSASPTTGT